MRRIKRVAVQSVVLCGAVLFAITAGAVEAAWQIGVAKAEITPQEPTWLAGYASRDRASEGALHPLWVKALALEDAAGKRALIVTSDLLGLPKNVSDPICERIKTSLDLDRANILLSSSHSHSTPVVFGSLMAVYPLDQIGEQRIRDFTQRLEDAIVRVAQEAFADLRPGTLSSGNGVTRFAVNRRNNREAEILDTHDFNGPVDHAVPVLVAAAPDGAPRAVLCGYACHATVLCEYQFCGDYPGFAQIELEKAYPGAIALFAAGCGADQNPLPRRSVALAEQYGRELAAAVQRAITDGLKPLTPEITTAFSETELPLAPAPSREELEKIAETGAPYLQRQARVFLQQLDAGTPLRSNYPYCLQLWRLGNQTIVAMGGEVVVDYAIFIKQMLGRDTFVFGYANDVMSYIPSERVLAEGGYEGDFSQFLYGMPAKWQEGIEARILDAARALANAAGLTVAAP